MLELDLTNEKSRRRIQPCLKITQTNRHVVHSKVYDEASDLFIKHLDLDGDNDGVQIGETLSIEQFIMKINEFVS